MGKYIFHDRRFLNSVFKVRRSGERGFRMKCAFRRYTAAVTNEFDYGPLTATLCTHTKSYPLPMKKGEIKRFISASE